MAALTFPALSRRNLIIGGGSAIGLVVAWQLWPRRRGSPLRAAPGEHVFGPFVKIGVDGRVIVAVPQAEMGQGVYTTLPQLVADELGADWRTIGVEPAPAGAAYANPLLAQAWRDGTWTLPLDDDALMLTGGSTAIRAFERPMRAAGAAARVLLCMAAARRLEADWRAFDTAGGFVVRGDERIRFGALAAEAAAEELPRGGPVWRMGSAGRSAGQSVPRLDLPAKIDGSARFAADVRLPDMVYAAIAQGPTAGARLEAHDRAAAERIEGVVAIEATERWIAAVANNSWVAARALAAARPRFAKSDAVPSLRGIDRALDAAFAQGHRIAETGDVAAAFRGASIVTAEYRLAPMAHAAIEPLAATAAFDGERLQLWIGTQAPGLAAQAAARACGIDTAQVTVHPMFIGSAAGGREEPAIAAQVALLAKRVGRPVQLQWSRAEDLRHDRVAPPSAIRLAARLGSGRRVEGWLAKIATPATLRETKARLGGDDAVAALRGAAGTRSPAAVEGAVPPYAIANLAVDHHPALIDLPTGLARGRAHVATCFATESFVDELAAVAKSDPFTFRIGLLGGNARLAQCLLRATAIGNWQGGAAGAGQGLACHMMAGSHIAVLAEAARGADGRVRVSRIVAVADCGRVINPSVVRQQIAGGLIAGMAAVGATRITLEGGSIGSERLGALGLPRLADTPWITIELVRSNAPPGGVSELAVPPAAPAIINALVSSGGVRPRALPVAPA